MHIDALIPIQGLIFSALILYYRVGGYILYIYICTIYPRPSLWGHMGCASEVGDLQLFFHIGTYKLGDGGDGGWLVPIAASAWFQRMFV